MGKASVVPMPAEATSGLNVVNDALNDAINAGKKTLVDFKENIAGEKISILNMKRTIGRKKRMKKPKHAKTVNIILDDHGELPKFIVPYDSKFRRWWDVLAVVFVLYLSYKIPLNFAFDDAWYFPSWLDVLMDVFFFADIALNFRTGFVHHGHHVTDPALIRDHYIKGWLAVDLLASIPFEALLGGLLNKSARKSLKMFKWLKFPRLLRLGRIVRYLKRNIKYYRIMLTTCASIFFWHFMACMWIGAINPCMDFSDLDDDGNGVVECSSEQASAFYASGLYTTLMTMFNAIDETDNVLLHGSTAASSQLAPAGNRTLTETEPAMDETYSKPITSYPNWFNYTTDDYDSYWQLYFISGCTLVLGFAIMIQFIAEVNTFSLERSVQYREFYRRINRYCTEMQDAGLDEELCYKVSKFYDYLWINKKYGMASKHSIIHDPDLSLTLRKEVALAMHAKYVARVGIFDGCSKDCIYEICSRLKFHIYMPEDVIFEQGDPGNELFIVRKGTVRIEFPGDQESKRLGEGSHFGELALLTNMRRSATVFSHTMSELNELAKHDFDIVMSKFAECNREVLEECSAHYPQHKEKIMKYGRGREELEKEELEKAEQEANGISDIPSLAQFISEKFAEERHVIDKIDHAHDNDAATGTKNEPLEPAVKAYLDEKFADFEQRLLDKITTVINNKQ